MVVRDVPLRVELGEAAGVPSRGCCTVGAWRWSFRRGVVDDRNFRVERVAFGGLVPGGRRAEVARRGCSLNDWAASQECLFGGDPLGLGRYPVDFYRVEVEGGAAPLTAGTCKRGQGLVKSEKEAIKL